MSEGEVINTLVFQACTDDSTDIAVAVCEYLRLQARNQTVEQFMQTIIYTISFLLTFIAPKYISANEAFEKIKTSYYDFSKKLKKAKEH